ncbi:DUF2169 family type VI secretion system accessory protein [Serratia marcescens]|uniref:DUF2169 family type VI secretion system accessory protein n=1 Tax=Serratia marcescens TaxID=615 RepID=UPI0034D73AE2
MKVVKPLRLSALHRPFSWQGQNHLGVSILALADMGASPRLRPEPELWQLAADELTLSGGVLDLAIPKACAEFLATGNAYTHHQQDKTACAVKIQLDSLEKTLVVFGDRHWINDRPSSPLPFAEMRLDWRRAYGGAQFADNPHGIGATPETFPQGRIHRLPNVEPLQERLASPRQSAQPASFDALDITWPRRFSRIGKNYDADWLKHGFPGFANDIDWRLFNMAESDQQFPQRDSLPLQAAYRIWNMHPSEPVQQGRLPPWRARCFINRLRGGEAHFGEVAMRHTTVWFFPHREQMLLNYQGSLPINEDDAADVMQLMPALEIEGKSRTVAHYRQVLDRRLDKEHGALHAFREKDLLPECCIGPWLDTETPTQQSPMVENIAAYEHHQREQHRQRLQREGRDIDDMFAAPPAEPMPALDQLAEFVDGMEQRAEAHYREIRDDAQANGIDIDGPGPADLSGAESYQQQRDQLFQQARQRPDAFSDKQLGESERALHQMYLMSAQAQSPALRLSGDLAQIIRQRVTAAMQRDKDLSGLDLTGADLSGMDLSHATLRGTLLENANLRQARLVGCDLREAMLARADLCGAVLQQADLSHASLALAKCEATDFGGAQLHETNIQQTLFQRCDFTMASLRDLLGYETLLGQCDFSRATLANITLMELQLEQLTFSHARLDKVSFIKCRLLAVKFEQARLESCAWVDTETQNLSFRAARLTACAFAAKTLLPQADFSDATLNQCNLRQMPLQRASFSRARLNNCDLSETRLNEADFNQANGSGSLFIRSDLTRANLRDANFIAAILQKCVLSGADLQGANLFRADLSQSKVDKATRLDDAYTARVKTLPRHNGKEV